MWLDYAIYLTTTVVLLSLAGLVLIMAKRWGTWVSRAVFATLILAGVGELQG